MWAVDAFAALTTGAVHQAEELPTDLYDETFPFFNSLVSPWHQWLDPVRYNRHVDRIEALQPGPWPAPTARSSPATPSPTPSTGSARLAGEPRIAPPGQEALDEILAQVTAVPAA